MEEKTGIESTGYDKEDIQQERGQGCLQHLFSYLLLTERDPEEQRQQVIEVFLKKDPGQGKIEQDPDQEIEETIL